MSFAQSVVSNEIGLLFSFVTCSAAAVLTLWGAQKGVIEHRFPRILLGVAVAVIAISYGIDLIVQSSPPFGADMRRGAGWLLWPSLAWTAWSGVVYGRKAAAVSTAMLNAAKSAGKDGDE